MTVQFTIYLSIFFSEIHAQQYETIFLSGQKEEEWSGMYICNNNK